ncbi:hypothetical protein TEQG_08293 [Trichophyton equinum CBS 127.97]|uniref:Uncharacterized protein n=1 Tax=Trichophyton equinum (strain ATCC MYA-4606 / CBS 127.97) TaxID=559882 RepID=F2Q5C7_TRIEC|nr:hypothetical protein TEQG_08293 [Trichophyton equinum CBS 127.97]
MRQLPLRKRRSRTSRLRHSLFGSRRSSNSESVDSESSQWTDCSASTEATDATEHEQELSGQKHHKPEHDRTHKQRDGDVPGYPEIFVDNVRDRIFSHAPMTKAESQASDALQDTTSTPSPNRCSNIGCTVHPENSPLSGEELRVIFSGAPQFLLEKGSRCHWFPHVVFPWDDSTRIQNLQDRKPLQHASFTLSTLHAHLPAFLERRKTPGGSPDLTELETNKHPAFDIGVFEVPNMLSSRAKERGCVGFRHYMELPISPKLKDKSDAPPGITPIESNTNVLNTTPTGNNEPYICCRPSIRFSRTQLISGGPPAWRLLGVRDCSPKQVAQRLETLCDLRDQMVFKAKPINLFDIESITKLHQGLFSTFLFPLPKQVHADAFKLTSIKTQIDTLVRVLAVKDAWIDFSQIEWRIRAGQILWECPPHHDGVIKDQYPRGSDVSINAERHWLLIQILLAAELVLRLDAAFKDEEGKNHTDKWVEVELTDDIPGLTVPRIYKTTQVLLDSSPLGPGGELTPEQFCMPMDDDSDADSHHIHQTSVVFDNITLTRSERDYPSKSLPFKATAHAFFTIKATPQSKPRKVLFPLSKNSLFISSFPCLPPRGWAAHSTKHSTDPDSSPEYHRHFQPPIPDDVDTYDWSLGPESPSTDPLNPRIQRTNSFRVPGHPLHTSFYPYKYIPITSLPSVTEFPPKPPRTYERRSSGHSLSEEKRRHRRRQPITYIIDARGCKDKEAFARAWCTAVCTDAVISRVGRTCLACSIREARAVDVNVVIRVASVASVAK